jgi:hypothetical protein
MDLANEFLRIFTGNNRAHGEYIIKSQKGAKAVGQAKTIAKPPSQELWQKHLNGELGLGVVPICEDSTCVWGAVDIDEYEGLDLEELSFKIPAPLVLCRSKSGGMHVYLFTITPVPAKLLRKKLAMVARALGHPNAEIFPKQDELKPEDIGNWINVPYYGAENTTRYCLKGGVALSGEEFVNFVGENAINIQQLVAFNPDPICEGAGDPEFEDAPPCLKILTERGFPPGSRNAALFSMGVFARMKFASGWEDKVFDYNNRFMGPGTYSEVAGVIRSLNKKSYVYKCKDQPLLSVCDKEACALCTYGVQPGKDEERNRRPCVLDKVDKVKLYEVARNSKDDPYWVFCFGEREMDVTIDMTKSQALFSREFTRQFYSVILPIKDSKWRDAMNGLINPDQNPDIELHKLAPDAGPEGQMLIHLEEFCTNKAQAKVRDELLLGKPWHDGDRTYFRSSDFMKYLDQQRFRALKGDDIIKTLKRNGSKHHNFNLKGKHVACWSIPSFKQQDEGFDREKMEDDSKY